MSPWHLRTKPEKNARMNPSHIKYLFFGHFHPSCSPCIFFKTHFFAFRCTYLIIHTSVKKKKILSKATGLCDRSSSGRGSFVRGQILRVCMWLPENTETGTACRRWPSSASVLCSDSLLNHHWVSLQSLPVQWESLCGCHPPSHYLPAGPLVRK